MFSKIHLYLRNMSISLSPRFWILVCLVQVHVINTFIEYYGQGTLTAGEIRNKVELRHYGTWGKD